ncbi:sodium:solute symporter family protein [Aeoliella sp. ICT_H6.2]|uniref:Sodium:solute symporter family protein n=1 Tax=Aeoliella straminimaris TaxID=2954799 RepID=A0A9X2JIW8_9BACT|nr:sodium:solute symporter family protein [Aeoliella straminimaris]MCO6046153.1 sodium:solute symporter family protein [Aeoliella straminimaris]
MNLLTMVVLYLLGSIAIGLYAARRVKTAKDFAVAGRSLPLAVVVATTFATWVASETVLGLPAKFATGGLRDTIEDPWGAGMCLVLVGLFFARKLYRMDLMTIGDYYRDRYGRVVEVFCSAVSIVSYLGWVAAQITALGIVFYQLSDGWISPQTGAIIGTAVVLLYTMLGGMWSVALTDAVQMTIIVIGLSVIAVLAANMAGGPGAVLDHAVEHDLHVFFPPLEWRAVLAFVGAGITIMLGSIPQQDVFQRVMSAKDERTAAIGPVIGGVLYMVFALVPMFIALASLIIIPDESHQLLSGEHGDLLVPTLVRSHMPAVTQVLFFGALLSAIMSTASATILAPSTIFVENILRHLMPSMNDHQELRLMRGASVVFAAGTLAYALRMAGTSIYDLVSSSYEVPVVGAVVPLAAGLYWPRATNRGAILSIVLGVGTWLLFMLTPLGETFPQQLAGLLMAVVGMVIGSLPDNRRP